MKAKVKATTSHKARANDEKAERSSGNVFADLGFRDSEERLLKAKLATKIAQLIEKKGWTQTQTAERTGLDQPKVSHRRKAGPKLRQLSGLAWTNPKYRIFCEAGFQPSQRIVYSPS